MAKHRRIQAKNTKRTEIEEIRKYRRSGRPGIYYVYST